jgi:hydrogenase nickel incorporation protein HypA/HybF
VHELSLAQSIVAIACRHAAGRRVTRVAVKVGHLRQVVPAALTFSFTLVSQGTEVEGAELALESVPAICICRRCGARTEQGAFPLQCRDCGSFDVQVVAGEELIVEALDVEEEELGALSN